ncbi:hypothetical protein L1285_17290 [Pseudoalteromonas sp. DL2-H2.2]|uniref:hypothetical protein n=1 Tax=Pseudoalteromonas sp. DL2-H2.2 TaxID=2908889 RepID=UPI001F2BDB4D|nr:hypothetical protein [Pseudoalteromonas sp. DL2-H2.2]MCF2910071.1 hypothetical protein [Pseudoalteromonas sp. DL2-H2.2]
MALVAGSYLFEMSFLGVALFLSALFFIGGIVTEGEYMPGQMFNPDDKELHPAKLLSGLVLVFVALLALGYFYPSLYNYGAYGS